MDVIYGSDTVRLFLILLFLLSLSSLVFAEIPIDYNRWQVNDTTFRKQYGGQLNNYPNGGGFSKIDNTLLTDGDSVLYCDDAILKTRINKTNGEVAVTLSVDGTNYTVQQKPVKLVWLNTQTKNWTDVIPSLSWGIPIVDTTSVQWNFPGFDYTVIKNNGQVFHKLNLKNAFLDSAITLYNNRIDSSNIALGLVHRYSFTNIDDSVLINIADVDSKRLKQFADGGYFDISKQTLQYDSMFSYYDSTLLCPKIPVRQRWVKQGVYIYLVEYVMMSHIKVIHELYPEQDIWHYTTSNYGRGADECDATYVYGYVDFQDTNYGNDNGMGARPDGCCEQRPLVKNKAVDDDIDGMTVSDASLTLRLGTQKDVTLTAYRIRGGRDWVETEVTWNDYKTDNAWGTAGGMNTTSDIYSTPLDAVDITDSASADDITWDITSAATAWAADTTTNQGVILHATGSGDDATTWATDDWLEAERPYMSITYTVGGAAVTPSRRRKIMQLGGIENEEIFNNTYFVAHCDYR